MTMLTVVVSIDPKTGLPMTRQIHPFFARHHHVPNYHRGVPARQNVRTAKRTGRGYPCLDYTSDLVSDPTVLTRQIKRYRTRRNQFRG